MSVLLQPVDVYLVMRTHRTSAISCLASTIACLAAMVACGSSNGSADGANESATGSGGVTTGMAGSRTSDGIGGAATTTNRALGGASALPIGTIAAGTSAVSPSVGVTAEQTPNGLYAISSTQANSILSDPVTSCAGWADQAELASSIINFVVDISGSMGDSTPATGGKTKWAVTRSALLDAISQLPPELLVGMSFYPNLQGQSSNKPLPRSACIDTSHDIPIAPLTDTHFAQMSFAVDSMEFYVQGATPTHDAYEVGLEALRAQAGPGKKYLVLITDGQPTLAKGCVGTGKTCPPQPTQPIIDAIAAADSVDQVQTFIVGSPGSEINECNNTEQRSWLSAAARAGGTATAGCTDQGPNFCHFDLTQAKDFGVALTAALGAIAKTVVACDYSVPPTASGKIVDTSRANMIYDDGNGGYSLVLPSTSADCSRGWKFSDATLTQLHVCEDTCALLQSNPRAKISLVFGCTQEQIQTPLL